MSLLQLRDVSVDLETADGAGEPVRLVEGVTLSIDAGETVCVVGESGSGKTVTALSVMRLLEYAAPVQTSGRIELGGEALSDGGPETLAHLRGGRIAMVFQECMEALNPTRRIGQQLVEVFAYHGASGRRARDDARARAADLLRAVEIRDPEATLAKYPHQLSGGMQQRVMIAMALMRDPELLIADEPTTALDVTVQAEILRLLRRLQQDRGMACLLITHDMGIAAQVSDRIAVMYAGHVVETGATGDVLRRPLHPYTRGLLACVPRSGASRDADLVTIPGSVPSPSEKLPGCRFAPRCPQATAICREQVPPLAQHPLGHPVACWNVVDPDDPEQPAPFHRSAALAAAASAAAAKPDQVDESQPAVVEIEALSKRYQAGARFASRKGAGKGGTLAVDAVSLQITAGEFFGLVGETGSGKSTLGRLVADLEEPTGGTVRVAGTDVTTLRGRAAQRAFRRQVQVVFQNSHGSLDPRLTVGESIAEPLAALAGVTGAAARRRVRELLDSVGLPPGTEDRRPGQMSGGQLQRVAVARAIAVDPTVLVADEPTSALDVSVQAQVMNLLIELQRRLHLTYLFISHNLSLVLAVADRVGVMYLGALVEVAPAADLATTPAHPYSAMLLESNPDPDRIGVTDDPVPIRADTGQQQWDGGAGCRFRFRCPSRQDRCDTESPELREVAAGHRVACHFPLREGVLS